MKSSNKNLSASSRYEGTTLVEIMVAISILVMALTAILGLVLYTSKGRQTSNKQVIATNLARECIEAVRNIRDTNWLELADRSNFLNDILDGSSDHSAIIVFNESDYSFSIDLVPDANEFPNNNDGFELIRTVDDFYIQDSPKPSGNPTGFFRIALLNDICQNDSVCGDGICSEIDNDDCSSAGSEAIGLQVICEVDWQDGGGWKKVILTDRPYDWKY